MDMDPIFLSKRQKPNHEFKHLLQYLCLASIATSTIYSIVNLNSDLKVMHIPNFIWGLGNLLSFLLLLRSKSQTIAAHMIIFSHSSYLIFLVGLFHHFPYTILFWLPVLAVICVYLLGTFFGGLWCLYSTTGVLLMLYGGKQYFPQQTGLDADTVQQITGTTIALATLATFGASYLFRRYIRKLLDEVNESNAKLTSKQIEIHQLLRDKDNLVAVVCHDIANPLSVISFSLQILKSSPEKLQKFLGRMDQASHSIDEIISSIRKFQAVQSGKGKIELTKVSVLEIFNKTHQVFKERLESKKLQLILDVEEDCEPFVLAEEVTLRTSVFNNILSNAIKFSPEGSKIIVEIGKVLDRIQVRIKDFGIGMPQDLAEKVFEVDVATSRKGTNGEVGTGFGLPIAKSFMSIYGGTIEVSSQEISADSKEHGTTFFLNFRTEDKTVDEAEDESTELERYQKSS